MKQERFAFAMILLALISGLLLTAATSGCDFNQLQTTTKQVAK
ncbi:MAG: hypothetical protein U0930_23905 [Pirellulales bacterium]